MSADEIKEKIVYMLCRTDGGNDIYVGSTSRALGKRFAEHKHDAENPSRLKWHRGSKLYERMREVSIQHWKIIPLLTFACDWKTICEFERGWVKALNANLNKLSPIDEDLGNREYKIKYHKKI